MSRDIHPEVEVRSNLKSKSHRCHLLKVVIVWLLLEEIVHVPLSHLQGEARAQTAVLAASQREAEVCRALSYLTESVYDVVLRSILEHTKIIHVDVRRRSLGKFVYMSGGYAPSGDLAWLTPAGEYRCRRRCSTFILQTFSGSRIAKVIFRTSSSAYSSY